MDSPETNTTATDAPPKETLTKSWAQQQREEEEEEQRKMYPKFYAERKRRESKEAPADEPKSLFSM